MTSVVTWSPACDAAAAILGALFPAEIDRHDVAATGIDGELRPPAGEHMLAGEFSLAAFQKRAAQRLITILDARHGAILADATGLGKTRIALAVCRHYHTHGARITAVVPAVLRRQWQTPLSRLLSDAVVLTHTQLSRGGPGVGAGGGDGADPQRHTQRRRLIVVDEAHAFRNPDARRYLALARLASNADLLLITATPVNNSLMDLYHLLRLFADESEFADAGASHLRSIFDDVVDSGRASPALLAVIRAVMVRRTRRDIQGESADFAFPARAPPVVIDVPVDGSLNPAHMAALNATRQLQLDDHSIARANRDTGSTPLLRFLVLKRMASSGAALHGTVLRLLQLEHARLDALRDGFSLRVRDAAAVLGPERVQLPLRRMMLEPLTPDADVAALEAVMQSNIGHLGILAQYADAINAGDAKLARVRHLVEVELARERVLVFTEFRDTAIHLWRSLLQIGGVAMIHGDGAFLGAGRSSRTAVISRFAPRANSVRGVKVRERVRVLIVTDVLAEGVNLQDCAHVVNYDLPWNPVRLIQRAGRVDRIGATSDVVYVYDFIPDAALERELTLLQRLHSKLHAIDMAVGLDHPVLAGRTIHDAQARDEALRAWLRSRKRVPQQLPVHAIADTGHGTVLVVRAGRSIQSFARSARGRWSEVDTAALVEGILRTRDSAHCAAALEWVAARESAEALAEPVWRSLRRHLASQTAPYSGWSKRPGSARQTPAAILARRLHAFAEQLSGADPSLLQLVDAALTGLAAAEDVVTESHLAELQHGNLPLADLAREIVRVTRNQSSCPAGGTFNTPHSPCLPEPCTALELLAVIVAPEDAIPPLMAPGSDLAPA